MSTYDFQTREGTATAVSLPAFPSALFPSARIDFYTTRAYNSMLLSTPITYSGSALAWQLTLTATQVDQIRDAFFQVIGIDSHGSESLLITGSVDYQLNTGTGGVVSSGLTTAQVNALITTALNSYHPVGLSNDEVEEVQGMITAAIPTNTGGGGGGLAVPDYNGYFMVGATNVATWRTTVTTEIDESASYDLYWATSPSDTTYTIYLNIMGPDGFQASQPLDFPSFDGGGYANMDYVAFRFALTRFDASGAGFTLSAGNAPVPAGTVVELIATF